MTKLLSVIIPTYNMEQYLEYCLDSLLIKRNFELLEIIVVNDGSKDKSLGIACQYEGKFPKVFRVIDKPNGNYGSCINAALNVASGKYVKVLDADDSFDKDNFEDYVEWLKGIDADLILTNFAVVDEARNVKKVIKYGFSSDECFDMDVVCATEEFKSMQMHAITYRRENLLSIAYKQVEGVSYTDQQWIFTPMVTVRKVYNYDKTVYKYLMGRAGQSMDPTVKNRQIMHTVRCIEGMLADYNTYKEMVSAIVLEYLQGRLIWIIKDTYIKMFADYKESTRSRVLSFDDMLKRSNADIYALIGSAKVSSFRGFEYLTYWRNNQTISPMFVRILCKTYVALMELKNRLKTPGKMAIPQF